MRGTADAAMMPWNLIALQLGFSERLPGAAFVAAPVAAPVGGAGRGMR